LVTGVGAWMILPLLLPQIFLPPPELLLIAFSLSSAEFAVIMRLTFTGDVIGKALQLAQVRLGDGYKYHVSAIHSEIHWQCRHFSTLVTAYNSHEIRAAPVDWQE
jgi:hypothetical protein